MGSIVGSDTIYSYLPKDSGPLLVVANTLRNEVNGAAVLTFPPEQPGVRCYNPPPADDESALFL